MLNIVLTGNLGNDPETRTVQVNGEEVAVTNFSVAVNNGKNRQGQELPPTWIRVSVWRNYALTCAEYLRKGMSVTVVAENIKTSAYVNGDGDLTASLEVSARTVDFSANRRREEDENIPF